MEIGQQMPAWFTAAAVLTLCLHGVGGTTVDLNRICTGDSSKFCILTNVTSSYEDPLKVINSTVPELQQLIIRNSAVSRLPISMFQQAPHLQTFIMHNCGLNRIFSSDFDNAAQLKMLALQGNRLFNVPEHAFLALRSGLDALYLGYNAIHIMHRRAFVGLEALLYLEAQYNDISALASGIFDDLINLQHIDMSHNELDFIDAHTFAKNTKLATVLLSDNKFTFFQPSSFAHLPHLRLLDLSNTIMDELVVQSVDVLLVQGSGLKRCIINGGVITLNAADNYLAGVTVDNALAVRDLNLHDNLVDTLNDFVGMLNLQRLVVSKNHLTSLRTSRSPLYLPLPNLEYLNLASNRLQNLSLGDFILMKKLTTLDVAFNLLSALEPKVFEPLTSLEKLYLEGNQLHQFDYEYLKRAHGSLHELGLDQNDWNKQFLDNMSAFFLDEGVHLPKRLVTAHSPIDDLSRDGSHLPEEHQMQHLIGVSGIHPYWTLRDILAFITLIIVLFILLIQFYRILQEERCCRWQTRNADDDDREPLNARHRLLVEDNSSV